MDLVRRAKRIRNQAQHRLTQIADLQVKIKQLKHELALLEVEYEEMAVDRPLLNPSRTELAPLEENE